MAEKSDIPRANASLRSTTPMVRITRGAGVDSARVRAWICVMPVPPRKEEDRATAFMDHAVRITPFESRRALAVPQPNPMLTQEVQWDQELHGHPPRLGTRVNGPLGAILCGGRGCASVGALV